MLKWIKSIFSSEKPLVLTNEVKEVKKKIETKPLVVKPSFKNKKELSSMTKAKLEEVGRVYGIELDKRLTKDKLVTQLWKSIK
jgi:fructose-1-phosphate kinase PfkB-like protein